MSSPEKKKASPPAKRVRRTAEEARLRILDAAEARLRDGGPEAIRLQDIAADVGISHPTILHHFENRDGLTRALGLRITERLVADLVDALTREPTGESSVEDILEHVFNTMGDTGTARLLAWRALSFESGEQARALLDSVTTLVHDRRVQLAAEHGVPPPSREDSSFVARLAAATALGDGLAGPIWADSPAKTDQANARFRRWFARLLTRHLESAE